MTKDLANNDVSAIVGSQLPEFIQQNYPNFVAFVEAYYEYLEQTGKVNNVLRQVPNYIDPDFVVKNDISEFVEYFRQTFLAGIPASVLSDKAKLIKHIKEYYITRGTPKSFKFLFRIMFNTEVDVANPGTHVLKVSDGKWYQPKVLRIVTGNLLSDWVGAFISGNLSYATAVVDGAATQIINGITYQELTLSNLTKDFIGGELVTGQSQTGNTLSGDTLGILNDIILVSGGSKYNVGDYVPIISAQGNGANVQIASVTSGSILQIGVVDGGAGFQIYPNFTMNVAGSATPVTVKIIQVDSSGANWPNTYTFSDSTVNTINQTVLSNIANTPLNQVFPNFVTYANCGPILTVQVLDGGSNFKGPPTINASQNVVIGTSNIQLANLGIVGTMNVISGGGNYTVNDDIIFTDVLSRGVGAYGIVTKTGANGAVSNVSWALPFVTGYANVKAGNAAIIGTGTKFTNDLLANDNPTTPGSGSFIWIAGEKHRVSNIANNTYLTVTSNFINTANNLRIRLDGFPLGGFGYTQSDLVSGAVTISYATANANASGLVVIPDSILGGGEVFSSLGSVYGQIQSFIINDHGSGYTTSVPVILDLLNIGDGTALANGVVIGGTFQYPGRFLNEDGLLSSRRYIQNKEKYNFYSYSLTSPVVVTAYKDLLGSLIHPAGLNMIGVTTLDIVPESLQALQKAQVLVEITNPPTTYLDISFVLDFSKSQ